MHKIVPIVLSAVFLFARPLSALEPEQGETKTVKIKIETSMGEILAELYPEDAPTAVKNFLDLMDKGFYKDMIFHRVIPDFMIQTGDPTGTGRGGPGYKFNDEFSPRLRHDKPGVIAMANSGPNTNGSQFYITETATPWLDQGREMGRGYTIFGQVTKGMDVVKAIAHVDRDGNDKPLQPVQLISVARVEG